VAENLNPDVSEFIPVMARIQSENRYQNSAETERTENGQLHEDLVISHKETYKTALHSHRSEKLTSPSKRAESLESQEENGTPI
jgi:hypothetical protein